MYFDLFYSFLQDEFCCSKDTKKNETRKRKKIIFSYKNKNKNKKHENRVYIYLNVKKKI